MPDSALSFLDFLFTALASAFRHARSRPQRSGNEGMRLAALILLISRRSHPRALTRHSCGGALSSTKERESKTPASRPFVRLVCHSAICEWISEQSALLGSNVGRTRSDVDLPRARSAATTHFSMESYAAAVPSACPEKSRGAPTTRIAAARESSGTVAVLAVPVEDGGEEAVDCTESSDADSEQTDAALPRGAMGRCSVGVAASRAARDAAQSIVRAAPTHRARQQRECGLAEVS